MKRTLGLICLQVRKLTTLSGVSVLVYEFAGEAVTRSSCGGEKRDLVTSGSEFEVRGGTCGQDVLEKFFRVSLSATVAES